MPPNRLRGFGLSAYGIVYPAELDDCDWAVIEQKGWLDVRVVWDGGERTLSFFDETRLVQAIHADIDRLGFFCALIVVLPRLVREEVGAVIGKLAERAFAGIGCE